MNEITLEIHRPDKPTVVQGLTAGAYTIGSDGECHIALPGANVSARHAVMFLKKDDYWVEDIESKAGTFLDGKKMTGRFCLLAGQKLGIGKYELVLDADKVVAAPATPEAAQEASSVPSETSAPLAVPELLEEEPNASETARPNAKAIARQRATKRQIHKELVNRLNLKRLTVAGIGEEGLRKRVKETIDTIIKEVGAKLPKGLDPKIIAKQVYDEAVGLGPLEELLEDEEVTEIMVNGHDQVYVEKSGKLLLTDSTFMDSASVHAVIERIVSPLGRRIDESQPYVDARLKDGSRVNAITHPLSLVGPCLTIRKFSKVPFTDQDLIGFGTMVQMMADFARACVKARLNTVISGGTGSGKTSLLNVFSNYLPDDERIVTIEDAAELRLKQLHIVRLEARPPNIEGRGAITIRDLVRNALRMRPDRIVVGECRGGEALDMLQAMNTGHDGSLTTVHANAPRDVISRLETMVLMSGMDLPVRAIREQIAAAIDLIVHESRFSDGSRKIVKITEVVGLEGDRITMQDLFEYVQTGISDDGKVEGYFAPTGSVPTFVEEFEQRGVPLDRKMFDPQQWGRP